MVGKRWVGEVARWRARGVGAVARDVGTGVYGGGGRQRTCRVAASTGGGVVGTSETPQGSRRSGRSVKRQGRGSAWFVRLGLQSGVAIRLDIILSSAPAARFSGFATLDGATLASPNSWCLLVSALRSDCVERGGDLDDRVDADHGKLGPELRNREKSCKTISTTREQGVFRFKRVPLDPKHLGFGGGRNRLGLPFYEKEHATIFPSVGLREYFQQPVAGVRFNSRPVINGLSTH